MKSAAEALISNNPSGKRIVFHLDNQVTLKTLVSTVIRKKTSKETRETLNKLGRKNTVALEWEEAHVGILGNEEADKLAKDGGNSTAVLGSGLTAKKERTQREHDFQMDRKMAVIRGLQTNQSLVPHP